MSDLFLNTFLSVFQGIIKIFIIAGIAGILVWKKVIQQSFIDGLSNIMVYAFLPSMIFSTIISGFNPHQEKYWWIIPLAAIIVTFAGLGIAALMFIPDFKKHRNILPLSSMPNAAYLVLPIGEFLYPDQFEQFAVYCFLVVLGLNPVFWTIGLYLVTGRKRSDFQWKQLLTPPFIVNFIILPVISIAILYVLKTYKTNPLLADEMIIQSAAAPATALIIQVRTYGGDLKKMGGITFISYLITLIAIPVWLTVWKMITVSWRKRPP